MKLKELRRIAKRIKADHFYITEGEGEVLITNGFTDTRISLGYYSGKNESLLGTSVKVNPVNTPQHVNSETNQNQWLSQKEVNELIEPMIDEFALDDNKSLRKEARDYAKYIYSRTSLKKFNPLEYLFEGAPVILEGCNDWTLYHLAYSVQSLRLPTIKESPKNVKLAWHPELGKPEGIDKYVYVVWFNGMRYPKSISKGTSWHNILAFMLLEKKDKGELSNE